MNQNLQSILQNALTLVEWAILLGGATVCVLFRHLSRGVWLIATGLAGRVAVGILYWLAIAALRDGPGISSILALSNITGVIGMFLWILVVLGMAMTFRNVDDQLRLLGHMARREAIQ